MVPERVREGDIVIEKSFSAERKALVLWTRFLTQPLLTGLDKYAPYWSTYEKISEVIDHVDINGTIENSCREI